MIKEGVKPNHMRTLAPDGRKALEASRRRVRGPTAPGMRALVQLACSGLDEILKVVEGEIRDKDARTAIRALVVANARYAKAFDLPGFSPAGTFDETYALFKRAGCGLGRSRSYPRALRDLWDYTQTPAQVEAAGRRLRGRGRSRLQGPPGPSGSRTPRGAPGRGAGGGAPGEGGGGPGRDRPLPPPGPGPGPGG